MNMNVHVSFLTEIPSSQKLSTSKIQWSGDDGMQRRKKDSAEKKKMQEENKGHVAGKCFKRVMVDIFE